MSELPKCTSRWGHKFRARYSTSMPDLSDIFASGFKTSVLGMNDFLDRIRTETYERDICIRCGVTVEKSTTPKPAETQ